MTAKDGSGSAAYGIAILRIAVGVIFLAHGAQKAFTFGLGGTAGAFESMGIPLPALAAASVIGIEFLGGLALILGMLTRWVAVPLAATMAVATLLVHLPAGFFAPNGMEFTLALLASTMVFVLAGPGALAVDNVVAARRGNGAVHELVRR